ncbi:MAG: tetratricopeptide repeat protein [Thermodesulfobacteriota bacterium]
MKLPPPDQLTILVVDDMDNMRRSIRAMLKLIHYGRTIIEAGDGRQAWDILNKGEDEIHFIISDWNMPRMTGTELLNLVRASRQFRDIPFLMITAEANKEVVAEAAENEVDAYLTKPFVTVSLEKKLAELIHSANNPDPLTQLLARIRELEESGDIDTAIDLATRAVGMGSRTSRPHRELGRLYLKKRQLAEARQCFEQAIGINMLDVSSFHYLGQIYYQQDEIDRAIECFARAMDISPRHADRALKFANLLIRRDKPHAAEKVFTLILKNNPNSLELKEEIGRVCLDNRLYDLAARIFRGLLQLLPGRTDLAKLVGMAMLGKEMIRDAIPFLEKALEKSPEDIELLLMLAEASLAIRKPVPAEKWAVTVIRMDPNNERARAVLARID